ncbi:B-cell receptor CD22-like [Salvelinus fontinalis]|uniref:B-cell receptor CD22-like n=1 Tax=Salvelinus fontinalis TaxID=8038 RepID=UPI0024860F01|nr:B-cell receptor CD22-like [Salvelinus fontinalis]
MFGGAISCFSKQRILLLLLSNLHYVQAKAVLTIYPTSSQIFSGESVTLRCNIQRGEVTDWEYTWSKDDVDFLSRKHEYEIREVKISNSGDYWCLGTHIDNGTESMWSDAVRLTVTALPMASVKASPRGPLYSGETVTLQCDISDYRDWTYLWHRDNQHLPKLTNKTTPIYLPDQAGQYQCEGTRTRRPERTYLSSSLTIVVAALPKATLTITPNPAYTGETVTLTCSVGSDSGWRYTWYKDNTNKVVTLSGRHSTTGATFTISRAAESDQGLFWCQGEIQSRSISSIISDPVTITVKERPVAVLTLQPNWPQIFSGETVTLSCDIQGGREIEYAFYNSGKLIYTKTEPEYRISPAKNGLYTCEGLQKTKGLKHSQTSNAVQLTVLDNPQAVLSVSPQWLNPGDSVTLSCGVKESSTGWRFFWYRTVPYTAGLLSLSNSSYSVEPLSGSGTSEDSYTLIPAGPSHTGGYMCRAGRGDPVYDTLYSEPQFLCCEEKRNSIGWRLKRYREKAVESVCVSNWGSIAGSTCTIRSTYTGDSGVYWCESGSGDIIYIFCYTVGILILESPPYPITEGESMTLSCTNRYQETNPNTKVDFYKDGIFIRNDTTLEMTIPAVSMSDEGFYKCKSNEGESPESWVTVRGSIVSISVLPRLLCGLLVAFPFLLVSIVLMVKCCRARGLCSTAKSLQYELPSDNVIEQTESSV